MRNTLIANDHYTVSMTQQDRWKVQAVEISCRILEALERVETAGVTELADELDYSKSTIHSHLNTLSEERLVVKVDGQYGLGLRVMGMAERVKSHIGNYDTVKEEVEKLARATGEVAQFGLEEHGKITYLYKRKSDQGVETASRIGETQDIHCTGLGKAALSSMPNDRVRRILDEQGMAKKTRNTITDRDEFFDELERSRERGYVVDNEENVKGIRCVASPVNWGAMYSAVSVTGPVSSLRGEDELAEQVRHAANVIEVNSRFG